MHARERTRNATRRLTLAIVLGKEAAQRALVRLIQQKRQARSQVPAGLVLRKVPGLAVFARGLNRAAGQRVGDGHAGAIDARELPGRRLCARAGANSASRASAAGIGTGKQGSGGSDTAGNDEREAGQATQQATQSVKAEQD